jgi:hypothetical protein
VPTAEENETVRLLIHRFKVHGGGSLRFLLHFGGEGPWGCETGVNGFIAFLFTNFVNTNLRGFHFASPLFFPPHPYVHLFHFMEKNVYQIRNNQT